MKNSVLLLAFLFAAFVSNAQTEIKINPIGLLFGSADIAAEFGLNESSGVEAFAGFASRKRSTGGSDWKYTAGQLGGAYKFYFNPREGFDRFYVGAYGRYAGGNWKVDDEKLAYKRLAIGLFLGYKWVSRRNVVFELGIGGGRAFLNDLEESSTGEVDLAFDVDIFGRLALGYRFGGEGKK